MATAKNPDRYQLDPALTEFIYHEVLPLTGHDPAAFWKGLDALLRDFSPRNRGMLQRRNKLQSQIDQWHREHGAQPINTAAYQHFLTDIGYLQPEPEAFSINTSNVDDEIARVAGPQLVVPLKNARFALNAANARWGSLYDALYGTDAISRDGKLAPGKKYSPARGAAVIQRAREFLDASFPLTQGSHADANHYQVLDGKLAVTLTDNSQASLQDRYQLVGFKGQPESPTMIILVNNGLHIEILFDAEGQIGQSDSAGINDILMESALTAIMDGEDSVAAVDTEDKLVIYRNWLGLVQGNLEESFEKNGKTITRKLNSDHSYQTPDGQMASLPGRSLLLIRNVGLHMYNNLACTASGEETPEGIIDAVVTTLIASLDLADERPLHNSRKKSIYIVKPKLHGPEEVAFSCELFGAVEKLLGLPEFTVKIGIMDEERRTSANLRACIAAARDRVAFINTGFLDRTGDEIHTSMQAGAFYPKADIKKQPWFDAYEDNNVDAGLACGLQQRAQIGKGMWPKPDEMANMLEEKVAQPLAGANTAWVPSPTAATLHALHYHQVEVAAVQQELLQRPAASLEQLLTIPLLPDPRALSADEITRELENNCQGILGYVVHWINAGVGCSKIPDINNVGLMEDRATLRISSQHIANWLHHGVCTAEQVEDTLLRMAAIVDQQNAGDTGYLPMAVDPEQSLAYQAARKLVFNGVSEPNGYTEPTLHYYRKLFKSSSQSNDTSRPTAAAN